MALLNVITFGYLIQSLLIYFCEFTADYKKHDTFFIFTTQIQYEFTQFLLKFYLSMYKKFSLKTTASFKLDNHELSEYFPREILRTYYTQASSGRS